MGQDEGLSPFEASDLWISRIYFKIPLEHTPDPQPTVYEGIPFIFVFWGIFQGYVPGFSSRILSYKFGLAPLQSNSYTIRDYFLLCSKYSELNLSGLFLVISKWSVDDHFPHKMTSRRATKWGLITNGLYLPMRRGTTQVGMHAGYWVIKRLHSAWFLRFWDTLKTKHLNLFDSSPAWWKINIMKDETFDIIWPVVSYWMGDRTTSENQSF